ncbi:MAG: hypothetical protein Q8P78_02215 [bacterium]|nr:hypothetical protein [bacterium]
MNNFYFSIRSISKTIMVMGVFALFLAAGAHAQAADDKAEIKVSTTNSNFLSSVSVNPGSTIYFQMFYNSASTATTFTVDFPSNLSFADSSTANAILDSDTVQWTFADANTKVITFSAIVASGAAFVGTDHTLEVSFTTNGVPGSSTTATAIVGPIITGITPSTGNNLFGVPITEISGHGLASTTAVILSLNGSDADHVFDISEATIANTSISGPGIRVPVSFAPGSYWVLATAGGITAASNSGESVQYTVDMTPPTASVTYAQNGATLASAQAGDVEITVTFNESIQGTPKIAIDQPGSTDIDATDMAGSGTVWTYTYTVNQANGAEYEDGTATTTISNALDSVDNAFSGPATNATFTIDTIAPAPAITSLAGSPTSQTRITYGWTPSYTAPDFSGYEFYYGTQAGVTSLNGTKISSQTSGYSSLSASGTNSLALDNLTAGTPYYAVLYICDAAGNCSLASNEVQTTTQQNAVVSGGGGGGTSPSQTPTYQTYDPTTGTLTTGEDPSATEPAPVEETQSPVEEPVATVSPEQESQNQQVLGAREYAEGTLVRTADKKIYVSENGVLRHIASLEELRASYAGKPIADISASVAAYKEGDLIRASDRKIYVIANGAKRHITSLRELAANHFGKPIHDVSLAILLQY